VKIGFIGLGNMGGGMAANILKAKFPMTVLDVRRELAKSLLENGASWADTPKAVAERSDIVFTSLPGPREVEDVALGKNGIIEGIRPGCVYVDLSTNSPALVRHIYGVFKEKGADMMDSPVSGGVEGARSGRLALMVGGDEDVYERCKPVLGSFGDKVSYNGKIGSGSICKLMHNCIAFGVHAIMAECMVAGLKAGVEPRALWRTLKEGAVSRVNPLTQHLPATYFRGNFEPPSFALKLGFKDVNLAVSVGKEYDSPMPIASLVLQDLQEALDRGWGDMDATSFLQIPEERAGVQFRIPDAEIG